MASAISDIISVQATNVVLQAAVAQRVASAQAVVAQPVNTVQPVIAAQPTDIVTIVSPTAEQSSLSSSQPVNTVVQDLVTAGQSVSQLGFIALVQALQAAEQLTAPTAVETTRVTISEKGRQLAREAIIPVAAATMSSAVLEQSMRTSR